MKGKGRIISINAEEETVTIELKLTDTKSVRKYWVDYNGVDVEAYVNNEQVEQWEN